MVGPPFDANGAVRFDLKSGAASDARGSRLVLVPAAAFGALDGAALEALGAQIGRACGARVAGRLGGDAGVRAAQLEVVVSHLAGELAVSGLGALVLERWGRAMVAAVTNPSVGDDGFVAAVVGSAISAASGRELSAAAIGRQGSTTRCFLGSPATADRARGFASSGKSHAEILAALQGSPS